MILKSSKGVVLRSNLKDVKKKMPNRHQILFSKLSLVLISIIVIALLIVLGPVLQPFYIAAIIAYLSNPLVDRLQKWRVPRILGVIIVFVFMISLFVILGFILIPLITEQINLLINKLPLFFNWLQSTALPWINQKLGNSMQLNMQNLNVAVMEGIRNNQDIVGKILTTITSSSFTLIAILFQFMLIPVVTFYLLRDWNKLLNNFRRILPRKIEPTVTVLARRYNNVLRAFLRGQLLVMLILGFIYFLGLWIIGLQFALLIGMIAGLLSIVPYLGFITGLICALIAAYYQFHTLNSLMGVLLVFISGQCIESMLLTPLLVGDSIGLHPVAVIFAVLTGGYFFGFIGALIALPVAAAIMVLMRFGLTKYYRSSLYTL
jgi:predicted PurR-regulated permease PerM